MYTADLIWFTPLVRTSGKTRIASTATTRPASVGASTTRGNDGASDGPSSMICVHSIANLKHTTASPEKTPISTASSRKNRSSRSVKIACVHDSQRARKCLRSSGAAMPGDAAVSGAVVTRRFAARSRRCTFYAEYVCHGRIQAIRRPLQVSQSPVFLQVLALLVQPLQFLWRVIRFRDL